MAITQALLTLSSVAVGWILNEIGHARRSSTAKRAAMGRALADLLEIRHYLAGIEAVFGEVRRRWPIARADVEVLTTALGQILPGDADLPSHYNKAVDDIASYHPLLAFRLRSKEKIPGSWGRSALSNSRRAVRQQFRRASTTSCAE